MAMVQRICRVFVLLMGLVLSGWVAYNLLIELQPAAQGLNPIPAIAIAAVFIWVGLPWVRGRRAG